MDDLWSNICFHLVRFAEIVFALGTSKLWRLQRHKKTKYTLAGEHKYNRWVNSLASSGAMWWHRSRSTLGHVMACCLMAPSHYLNQCWPEINDIHPSVISRKMCKICWQKWSFEIKFLMIFMHMSADNGLMHKRCNSICLHIGMGHVAIAELSRFMVTMDISGSPIDFHWGSQKYLG